MAYCFDEHGQKVNLTKIFEDLQTAYQGNIDILYDKLVQLGETPSDKRPASIAAATEALTEETWEVTFPVSSNFNVPVMYDATNIKSAVVTTTYVAGEWADYLDENLEVINSQWILPPGANLSIPDNTKYIGLNRISNYLSIKITYQTKKLR